MERSGYKLSHASIPLRSQFPAQNEAISDMKRENQFLSPEISESTLYDWTLDWEICKPVLKLDFTAQNWGSEEKDGGSFQYAIQTFNILYQKSNLWIPRKGIVQPQPNSCIHVSLSDLYIPRIGPHTYLASAK